MRTAKDWIAALRKLDPKTEILFIHDGLDTEQSFQRCDALLVGNSGRRAVASLRYRDSARYGDVEGVSPIEADFLPLGKGYRFVDADEPLQLGDAEWNPERGTWTALMPHWEDVSLNSDLGIWFEEFLAIPRHVGLTPRDLAKRLHMEHGYLPYFRRRISAKKRTLSKDAVRLLKKVDTVCLRTGGEDDSLGAEDAPERVLAMFQESREKSRSPHHRRFCTRYINAFEKRMAEQGRRRKGDDPRSRRKGK